MTAFKLTRTQEQRLIAYALEQVIDNLTINGHDHRQRRTNGHVSALADFVTGHRPRAVSDKMVAVWKKKRRSTKARSKSARRKESARLLAKYSTDTPRASVVGAAPLIRHGYLKKSGDGYVRTGKTFTP